MFQGLPSAALSMELVSGWNTGFIFANASAKEEEVKQGKNYYMAAAYQSMQISSLSTVALQLTGSIPNSIAKAFTQLALSFASNSSLIYCPLFAAVRQGHYEDGVLVFNQYAETHMPSLVNALPEKLSEETTSLMNTLAEKGGNIVKPAMAAGTIALAMLGNSYFSAAMLVPMAYQTADSWNLIPRRISLFMENYLSSLSNVTTLMGGGSLLMQGYSILRLSSFSPGVNHYLQMKVDRAAAKLLKFEGVTLEEVDAPWLTKKNLSFGEINAILDCDDQKKFEINPAHCSKKVGQDLNLPKDYDFKRFMELFDKIKWSKKYLFLLRAFKDDDRFIDLIKVRFFKKSDYLSNYDKYVETMAKEAQLTKEEFLDHQLSTRIKQLIKIRFPKNQDDFLDLNVYVETMAKEAQLTKEEFLARQLDTQMEQVIKVRFFQKSDYLSNFEKYVETLAKDAQLTKEDYLAHQLKTQMEQLVKVLLGETRAMGTQKDVAEAIDYCSQILPHLLAKNDTVPSDKIELEDILLKLAIEGGEYCARGVKRASKEIFDGIVQQNQSFSDNPIEQYERELLFALEFSRKKIAEGMYQQIIGILVNASKSNVIDIKKEVVDPHAVAIAQDVHLYDVYRYPLTFGFVPFTEYERNYAGLQEIALWMHPTYKIVRKYIYEVYQNKLTSIINELGVLRFSDYIRALILNSAVMTDDEKEQLIEKFTERNNNSWDVEETNSKFQQLVCVMLGILNYNTLSDEWQEVESEVQVGENVHLDRSMQEMDEEKEREEWVDL